MCDDRLSMSPDRCPLLIVVTTPCAVSVERGGRCAPAFAAGSESDLELVSAASVPEEAAGPSGASPSDESAVADVSSARAIGAPGPKIAAVPNRLRGRLPAASGVARCGHRGDPARRLQEACSRRHSRWSFPSATDGEAAWRVLPCTAFDKGS